MARKLTTRVRTAPRVPYGHSLCAEHSVYFYPSRIASLILKMYRKEQRGPLIATGAAGHGATISRGIDISRPSACRSRNAIFLHKKILGHHFRVATRWGWALSPRGICSIFKADCKWGFCPLPYDITTVPWTAWLQTVFSQYLLKPLLCQFLPHADFKNIYASVSKVCFACCR